VIIAPFVAAIITGIFSFKRMIIVVQTYRHPILHPFFLPPPSQIFLWSEMVASAESFPGAEAWATVPEDVPAEVSPAAEVWETAPGTVSAAAGHQAGLEVAEPQAVAGMAEYEAVSVGAEDPHDAAPAN
jgi:hypothetical protein